MKKILFILCVAFSLSACSKDVGQKTVDLMSDLAAIAQANESDCAKMGSELKKYVEKNKGLYDELKAWHEKATDAEEKAMFEKYKDPIKDIGKKMVGSAMKCVFDSGVRSIMKLIDGL